jgi:hypothetical protein
VKPSPIATRLIKLQSHLKEFDNNVRIAQACAGEAMDEVEVLSSGAFLASFELHLDDPVEHSHEDENCHDRALSR